MDDSVSAELTTYSRFKGVMPLVLFVLSIATIATGCNYYAVSGPRITYTTFVGTYEVPDSDGSTMKILSDLVAKDKSSVYFMGKPIEHADPTSFVLVKGNFLGKDKNSLFYGSLLIENIDPESFTIVSEDYFLDYDTVCYRSNELKNIDVSRFRVISNHSIFAYATDETRVYFQATELEGCDLNTFRLVGEDGFAKDKSHVWIDGRALKYVDPQTFEKRENGYFDKYGQKGAIDENNRKRMQEYENSQSRS